MEPAKQDTDDHNEDERKHRTHFCKTERLFHDLAMIPEKRPSVQPWTSGIRMPCGQGSTVVPPYPLVESLRYVVGDHQVVVQEQGALFRRCTI